MNADYILLTRISDVLSKRTEIVLPPRWPNHKVIVFGVASVVLKVTQVNMKTLTSAQCQRMKNVVTCTFENRQCYAVQLHSDIQWSWVFKRPAHYHSVTITTYEVVQTVQQHVLYEFIWIRMTCDYI